MINKMNKNKLIKKVWRWNESWNVRFTSLFLKIRRLVLKERKRREKKPREENQDGWWVYITIMA